MENLVKFGFPSEHLWKFPKSGSDLPNLSFENAFLEKLYKISMRSATPLTIAIVYYSFVHFMNPIVRRRQLDKAKRLLGGNGEKQLTSKVLKRLPAAPFAIAKYSLFNVFVLLHNVFLCIYSLWTFVGMLNCLSKCISHIKSETKHSGIGTIAYFFEAVCEPNHGIFSNKAVEDNLLWYGYWFYLSKFYEVLDTIIILLKGRPSSLLQSYHHAGAMMCMWSGVRYQSPPIWIFVVFNSFIHFMMYFYFSLSCLKIRVPLVFKRALTTMQIIQFVIGGSLAAAHAFIWFTDLSSNNIVNCIASPEHALPLIINVAYLAPLTALFAAFYIESYIRSSGK